MLRFASAEHGYSDEAGVGAKELVQKLLKLPKKIKDMLFRIDAEVNNDERKIRLICVVGYSHTHLRVVTSVMDAPAGYVCKIEHQQELRIPTELQNFYKTSTKHTSNF
ncbi:hypothetical protein BDB00DRAFT_875027 [Zychaea mexicana]|uniref:uncharacterized protein n=1 Tax=Zychaea mexicana TaxID=64656 RepID=UPI0022FE3694|nr:uncharacterized protein BDB00DRAFT_875027 [Zychaea mexicana]KAI9490694.1 hypothetical protein BDB00DRAFT_875027 [Zychaea mexicana]